MLGTSLDIHMQSSSNAAADKYVGFYTIRLCIHEGVCSHFPTDIFSGKCVRIFSNCTSLPLGFQIVLAT